MVQFSKFILKNGLRVLVHTDKSTPMVVVNVMYDVGARDENPEKTGFAHLFEHLMFGGSINIPDYDKPLQQAGGENNAYTTNDVTNYYCQLPAANIETAFWLESDRMLSLAFGKKSLNVQKKVVVEEFKEHYINKPYGDVWHKLRHLAYKVHPYKWMTIGDRLSDIENATLPDVKDFFHKHYAPINAVLVVAGNIEVAQVKQLAQKWFEPIASGTKYERNIEQEPAQTQARQLKHEANVPLDAFYKVWHMAGRIDSKYYATDLLTEILGSNTSSRLYQALVKEKQLFTNISSYVLGSHDPGLAIISGKLVKGISFEHAEAAIQEEIEKLQNELISNDELTKVKNKTESAMTFEDMSLMNRAANLATYEVLGDANLINTELDSYQQVTPADIQKQAQVVFSNNNSSTLYYQSTQ